MLFYLIDKKKFVYCAIIKHQTNNKMNLDNLIEKAIIDVKYYQERLREAETKLDAFYIARDTKADNPYNK